MIIEIEKEYQETVQQIKDIVKSKKCRPDVLYGDLYTVIAVEGDATQLSTHYLETFPGVVRTWRISSPYKTISRKVIGENSEKIQRERLTVEVPGKDDLVRQFKDENYIFIAGPCAIESYEQLSSVAKGLAELADKHGIRDRMMLRGGAFKPRTRPWDFRGLGWEAVDMLDKVREETGLPYVIGSSWAIWKTDSI